MFQNTSCALKNDRASGNLIQFSPEFRIFHDDLLLIGSECLCVFSCDLNQLETNLIFIKAGALAARPDLYINKSHQI